MKKVLLVLFLVLTSICIKAQTPDTSISRTQPFGKIDTADLRLATCDFEKGAGAMVLFDRANIYYKFASIVMDRHKRIKIFNDHGKDEANIRIEYYGVHHDEDISDIEAETINLDGNNITYTKVDKALIYNQVIDKNKKAITFAFPNVKPGSIIEFKYKLTTPYSFNYPEWYFQSDIPSRYSELRASFSDEFRFKIISRIIQPMAINISTPRTNPVGTNNVWALSNVKSYAKEPYMDYASDYLQRMEFRPSRYDRTWERLGKAMLDDEDFGLQFDKSLNGEDAIITKAAAINTRDERIKYLFNTVKNTVKWNDIDAWYTIDGVKKAWNKKTGNSTEINLILYHLLKGLHEEGYLMVMKTRDRGWLDPDYPSLNMLNKTVVYYPVDSAKYYVLDASEEFNSYNNVPYDLAGLNVMTIDADRKMFGLVKLKPGAGREVILVNGAITPEGKFDGNTQISSFGYNREKYLRKRKHLSDKQYTDELQKENNGLKISSVRVDNVADDSLPLVQTVSFKYDLTEPDGTYMYFNPNLLIGFQKNPFQSENRVSNIDFRGVDSYSINERYKIPAGYKIDILPKSVSLTMPDKSISFKRVMAEQDGDIVILCTIIYNKAIFPADEYPAIRDFYKKMFEMLNEQIVLKKN